MSPVHCIFFGHVWRSDGESNKMQKEGGLMMMGGGRGEGRREEWK